MAANDLELYLETDKLVVETHISLVVISLVL